MPSSGPPQPSPGTPEHAPEPQGCHCYRSVPPWAPAPLWLLRALTRRSHGGTAEPQEPEQHKSTKARPVCHLSCSSRGSGSGEIRALRSGALGRLDVCWVLSPAVTMTRGSPRASPAAGFPVSPSPRQQTMSCLTAGDGSAFAPLSSHGSSGPSGRSNRKPGRERKRLFVLQSPNFHS